MKTVIKFILISILGVSCTERAQDVKQIPVESKESIENDERFNFDELDSKGDTFKLVSQSSYYYTCYGKYSNPSELISHYGTDFNVKKEKTFIYNDSTITDTLYRIKIGEGFLKYFFNEEESKMDLVSGTINSEKLAMSNGVKIGESKSKIWGILFEKRFLDKLSKYNVIQIETALTGIWINFIFEKDILKEIKINSDYHVNKE